jgi:ATP-binding cassette, subfamily B, bacterial
VSGPAPSSDPVPAWKEYGRLRRFLIPYRYQFALILLTSLLASVLGLVQPYVSKLLIDEALLRRDMTALWWTAGLLFGSALAGFALNIASSYRYVRVSAALLFDMRVALYRHLQLLSPRFYAKWRLGDLVSRINNDVSEIQRVSADSLLAALGNLVFLFGSIAMMLWLSPRLFVVSVALLPLSLLAFHRYQSRLLPYTRTLRERAAAVGSRFVETILGMRTVVLANAGEYEVERFRNLNSGFVATLLRLQMTTFLSGSLPSLILTASTAIVFVYGGRLVFEGQVTIGTLVAFMAYHVRLLSPVQSMMSLAANLAAARASLGRIFELLDTAPEIRETPGAAALGPIRRGVVLENVVLRHDRERVLDGVSLEIPAGTICAILGPSGSGKSTIADLLVRLLDPEQGRVLLDGRDLRDVRLADLRREVVLAEQMPYLFNATIAENIAYARPEASLEEIRAAGHDAGLDELIARLPQEYLTPAGERGLALSAGERQRIALARILLRRSSVLVLDEPTSALDAEPEAFLARRLRESLAGRTVIIITHRVALAEIADQVLELREGRIWPKTLQARR